MNSRPLTSHLSVLLSQIEEMFQDATSHHHGVSDNCPASIRVTLENGMVMTVSESSEVPSVEIKVPREWIVTPSVESKVVKFTDPKTGDVSFRRMTRREYEVEVLGDGKVPGVKLGWYAW